MPITLKDFLERAKSDLEEAINFLQKDKPPTPICKITFEDIAPSPRFDSFVDVINFCRHSLVMKGYTITEPDDKIRGHWHQFIVKTS